MNPWYAVTAMLLVAGVAGLAYWSCRPLLQDEAPPPAEVPTGPVPLPPGHVIVPAPRIGGDSLRDWLVHRHPRECREGQFGVWNEVVSEFYGAAAADPEIAAYFEHTDMVRLQRHFLSALLMLTHTGLTVGALNAMRTKHSGLNITGPVFDRTVLALAGVLESKGVPGPAIQQLLPAVEELRAVIVTRPVLAPPDDLAAPRHRRRTA